MLEIVRGRTWVQHHTVQDTVSGPLSDLTGYTFKSQIRKRYATKGKDGKFAHDLVVEVTISASSSVLTQSLTTEQTTALEVGEYLIDIIGTKSGKNESFLDPEVIRVSNRPTQP